MVNFRWLKSFTVVQMVAVRNEARRQDVAVGKPYDLPLGNDLLNAEQQRKVLEEIRKQQPFLVIIAFIFTAWSSLSNFKPSEQRMREQLLDKSTSSLC